MDMSQYLDLFLSETREHINNLNKLVVTLEQEPGNRKTIDALFREAHSIKGMAATMGFDRTAKLAHFLEDLLDGFRASGKVPATTIDFLLIGIDLLDGLLDDLQANRPERAVDAFLRDHSQDEAIPVAEILEEPFSAADIEDALEEITPITEIELESESETATGVKVASYVPEEEPVPEKTEAFQILVDLAEDTPAVACGILVLREVEKFGELIASKPDMADLRGDAPCRQIQAWLRTPLDKEHIEKTLMSISGVVRVRFIDDRRKEDHCRRDEDTRTIRVRTGLLDQFVNLTGELITHRHMLNTATSSRDWENLTQTLGKTSRLIDDLHHHVLQARLMPLENIAGRLPRIVRDISRKTDKKVTLRLAGTNIGIDRAILEELTDPLVHLVRNAVDHGIEKEGVVTVSACREKDLVLVEVADNGKGMHPGLLRQKAVDCALLTSSQAADLSDNDVLMLVCRPGFSTSEKVTETSGRGVGMDVVKSAISKLGGTLKIISAPNEGTRFQMRLPLSIAIIKIVLVSCAGHLLAIPITRVQRTLDIPTSEIQGFGHKRVFRLGEEDVSLYSLTAVLGLPAVPAGEITWVVLTEVQGRRIGLQVDRFIGHREAFVKSLGFPLNLLTGLSGAAIEGDGQVVFIVDPQSLFDNRNFDTEGC